MRRIIFFIAVLIHFSAAAQVGTVKPLGSTNPKDLNRVLGGLQVDSIVKLLRYASTDTCKVLGVSSDGSFVLRDKCVGSVAVIDSNVFVTLTRLKDSLQAIRTSISGADSSVYSTVSRLRDSITALENRILAKGYLTAEIDGSVTNELQTLSLPDSQHIAISNGNNVTVPWLSKETDPTVDGKITDAFNTLGIPLYRVTATGDSTADSIILKNGYRVPIPSGFYSSIRSAYNMNGLSDSVRLMFGVARPTFSGAGNLTVSWSLLGTTDGHTSLHIDSVKGIGPTLYIYFPTVKYMGFALAKVDDDLADIVHAQVGCRGNLNDIEVRGSVPGGTRQGYFIMPAGALTTYGLDFVNIDTSVTASGYSFKITTPTADNTNRYVANGNYAGSNTARISAYYAGANSYHIHKIDDKWNPTFVILDMFGNTVPLKALDANDKIIVDTGMPFTFALTWDYNNNGFFATTSAIWIAAWVKI